MRFGISTHLYHDRRLEREHLAQIAGYGFEAIELFATRSHFDYRDAARDRRSWRPGWRNTGLTPAQRARADHGPRSEPAIGGRPTFSNAVDRSRARARRRSRDAARRSRSPTRIPFDVLVVHLGTPASRATGGRQHRAAALRSLEEICRLAAAARRAGGGRGHPEPPVRRRRRWSRCSSSDLDVRACRHLPRLRSRAPDRRRRRRDRDGRRAHRSRRTCTTTAAATTSTWCRVRARSTGTRR